MRKIEKRLGIESLKQFILDKYEKEKLNVRDIAEIIYGKRHYSPNVIVWMDKFGIERRDRSTAVALQWVDNENRKRKQSKFFAEKHTGHPSPRRLSMNELKERYKKHDVTIQKRKIIEGYTTLVCKCDKCGSEFDKKLGNLILNCPMCSTNSKGEKSIKEWADKNGCEYKVQYKISECRNLNPLPFDFAIFYEAELKYLVEFDGMQHYEPVDFFGGEEGFKERKRNDKIKNKYCKKNNIPLIRIPYWDFDKVEEILSNEIVIELALF